MKEFTFYWLTGKREVLKGDTQADAFNRGGYSAGAIRALDFYAKGNDRDYYWDSKHRTWERKRRKNT